MNNEHIIDDETPEVISLNTEENKSETPEEKPPVVNIQQRKKQKVVIEFPVFKEGVDKNQLTVILPSHFDKETTEVLVSAPNVSLVDNVDARQWINTINEGSVYNTLEEVYVDTLEDESAEFKQKIDYNGSNLMAGTPKFKPLENQNIKGERAIIRLVSHLGLGSLFQVPLWHSGIWITFKPASESELVELSRRLNAEKIEIARQTYGLSFSNTIIHSVSTVVDFALNHIYEITAKTDEINLENIKDHISCQDIPSLLWGFICTAYPKGFNYSRACINSIDKCNHIVNETLNVTKLQWTNTNALTDWQKTFMSGRQANSKDLASINRYKEELTKTQSKTVTLIQDDTRNIRVTLKSPSIFEHIDSGHTWLGDIIESVTKVLGSDVSSVERNTIIERHSQATLMRQYAHWVKSIEYDTNIIDDKETISKTLDILSGDDVIRNKFTDSVIAYINSSTISVIGIPVYTCPNCDTVQTSPINLPSHTNIIPLDVIQLFFELMSQRLRKLINRSGRN